MDDRLRPFAEASAPGLDVNVKGSETQQAEVLLSWGSGTSLVATQLSEWIEVRVHGIKVHGNWVSRAEVELFLETLSGRPTERVRRRFSTVLQFPDGDLLGSRSALRGRLPEAAFPAFPGLSRPVTWFALYDDGLLIACKSARDTVWLASMPESRGMDAIAFSSDGRLLTLHDHPDGYDGISAVTNVSEGEVATFIRRAANQPLDGPDMTDAELITWHSIHSPSDPWQPGVQSSGG